MTKYTIEPTYDSVIAPASTYSSISLGDRSELPQLAKTIYVGEVGNIMLSSIASADFVTLANVPARSIIDVRARQIRATDTTATLLVGLA